MGLIVLLWLVSIGVCLFKAGERQESLTEAFVYGVLLGPVGAIIYVMKKGD